jgi:hypothetical protein
MQIASQCFIPALPTHDLNLDAPRGMDDQLPDAMADQSLAEGLATPPTIII